MLRSRDERDRYDRGGAAPGRVPPRREDEATAPVFRLRGDLYGHARPPRDYLPNPGTPGRPQVQLRPRQEAAPGRAPSTWWIDINSTHWGDPNERLNYITPHQRRLMETCDKDNVRRGRGTPPDVTNWDLLNKGLHQSGLDYRVIGDTCAVDVYGESVEIECDHRCIWTRSRITRQARSTLNHIFERLYNPDVGWKALAMGRGPGGPRRRPKTDAMRARNQARREQSPRDARRRSRSRRRRDEAAPREPSRRRQRAEAAPRQEPSRPRRRSRSRGRSREAAPRREPSDSRRRGSSPPTPPPRPFGHRDSSASSESGSSKSDSGSSKSNSGSHSSDSDRSPALEAGTSPPEAETEAEVRHVGDVRGRTHTANPAVHVAPTLAVKADVNKLLRKERDPQWREAMLKVYAENPELIDQRFSKLNDSTGWRRCLLCGKDIGTGHESSVSHLQRMKDAFKTLSDPEKIQAMQAYLIVPAGKPPPTTYINFCRYAGVDTIEKRLELAEAKKAQEMRDNEMAIKQER